MTRNIGRGTDNPADAVSGGAASDGSTSDRAGIGTAASYDAEDIRLIEAACSVLAERGIKVWRSYVGEYCTSLEMAGASITLVKLDDEIKELLSAPAEIAIRVF